MLDDGTTDGTPAESREEEGNRGLADQNSLSGTMGVGDLQSSRAVLNALKGLQDKLRCLEVSRMASKTLLGWYLVEGQDLVRGSRIHSCTYIIPAVTTPHLPTIRSCSLSLERRTAVNMPTSTSRTDQYARFPQCRQKFNRSVSRAFVEVP